MQDDTTPATKADLKSLKADMTAQIRAEITEVKSVMALKTDVTALRTDVTAEIDKLYKANERWKNEINVSIATMMGAIGNLYDANERWKDELKADFRLVIEDLKYNFFGFHKDKISLLGDQTESLDKRVTRLEVHAGI